MNGTHISAPEAAVAITIVVAGTVAQVWSDVSSDALVGIYASVLGFVFGRGVSLRLSKK